MDTQPVNDMHIVKSLYGAQCGPMKHLGLYLDNGCGLQNQKKKITVFLSLLRCDLYLQINLFAMGLFAPMQFFRQWLIAPQCRQAGIVERFRCFLLTNNQQCGSIQLFLYRCRISKECTSYKNQVYESCENKQACRTTL